MSLVMKLNVCLALLYINVGATILIVGDRLIRKNQDYNVVISNVLGETNEDCLLNLRIEGLHYRDRSTLLNLNQTVKVMADTNRMVSFKIPDNQQFGMYKFIIEGKQPSSSCIDNIYQEVQLNYDRYYADIRGLIQLNKPVITPGDILKIRLIVVDNYLKPSPLHEKKVSVTVDDPNGNVIRQWPNVSLLNAVFETQIAIPSIPILGTYKVHAWTNDQRLTPKVFEVKNYDLDLIDINIYQTALPFRNHQALNLSIDVKNYLVKPVGGNFTIVSVNDYWNNLIDTVHTWEVNGKRQIYLLFNRKLKFLNARQTLHLNVTFTEEYTNRTTTTKKSIVVYGSKYNVEKTNKRLEYQSGSPFIVKLKVTDQNEEPAKNVTLLIQVIGDERTKAYRQDCTSNMKGHITFSMQTNESTEISLFAVYDGDTLIFWETISRYIPDSYTFDYKYIKVELLTRVKFNRIVRLLVTCSHKMTILLYYLITKGNIVAMDCFRLNQMSGYTIELLMSDKFIPRSKIFVFTVVNKTLLYRYKVLSINEFGNPLEIKIEENISEDGVDPGDEIELSIRGRPGSFVALAAYDQRLMQHGQNHDILFADVWDIFDWFYMRRFDSLADKEIFATTTDNTITVQEPFESDARGIYPNAPRFGMPGPYRTEFWESWLWQNLTIPPSGRYALEVTVPHSTTSWYITGISIDPKYGLGVVKKRITFSTVKIFYVLDHLPHSIKRGETVSLHFNLFSSIDEAFEANVTMFNANNQMQFMDRPAGASDSVTIDTKVVSVPPNSSAPVSFLVKAMKLGELEIRVNASIMKGIINDSFKKVIIVLPEDLIIQGSNRVHFDRDFPLNESFDILFLMDEKAEDDIGPTILTIYPNQQSLKVLQKNYNVSISYLHEKRDGSKQLVYLDLEYKGNIPITSIPANVRNVSVIVTGSGSDVIQFKWQYRINLIHSKRRFDLQLTQMATPSQWMKQLHICFSFIPEATVDHSNGTFVEVSIPIGYAMDSHNVVEDTTINPISSIEILHGGTTLMIYYRQIGNETNCFSVFVYRRFKMRERHPSYIKVQDSYHPELNAVKMYDFH